MDTAPAPASRWKAVARRVAPFAITAGVFWFILQRVPLARLQTALADADYVHFLALMIPNGLIFFCWDTLILTMAIRWFHGPLRYTELLPARAVSYVVALFNTNLARGALAAYLARRLRQPLLQLGSTVIFLVMTEFTHLTAWATLGLLLAGPTTPRDLLWVPPAVVFSWALFLAYTRFNLSPLDLVRAIVGRRLWPRDSSGPRHWAILRTFRIAPLSRYIQTVALRAPMFFLSLVIHYLAAPAFGIHIPFVQMVAFLPVIFMIGALPITVAHLGTTQAAWIFFFSAYAPAEQLLAFSLAAHATFTVTRAAVGLVFTPKAYDALVHPESARAAA